MRLRVARSTRRPTGGAGSPGRRCRGAVKGAPASRASPDVGSRQAPEVEVMHADTPMNPWRARTLAAAAGLLLVGLLAARGVPAQTARSLELAVDGDERWWVGVVSESHRMPLGRSSAALRDRPPRQHGGQPGAAAPALDEGPLRVVRGALPPRRPRRDDPARLGPRPAPVGTAPARRCGRPPSTPAASFFPPSGKTPDPMLFTHPQFNTWIELTYDQNQRDVLAYARAIVGERLPAGGPDDRRGLGGGLRRLGLPPRPLPGPEGDDGRAPRHGLQGHALGLPLHPARREAVHGAPPRRRRASSGSAARRTRASRRSCAGGTASAPSPTSRARAGGSGSRASCAASSRRTGSTASSSTAATPSTTPRRRC